MLEFKELMDNVIKSQSSDLYHTRKIDLYKKLSENFSMIPLWGNTKIAIDKGWPRYCHETNAFNKNKYKFKNAGICCGPASNLLVLDVDNPKLFEKMLRDNGVEHIPETFTVKTGMKGYQCYYLLPEDGKHYGVTVFKHDGEKVGELRGVGGYVVAPGSRHPDTGNIYEIVCFDQVNKASEFILSLNKEETQVRGAKRETKYVAGVYGEIDLYELGIPEDTIKQIQYPWPVGERSEKEMSVIFKLLWHEVSEESIHSVFEYCQIGEKHHERGVTRHNILQHQIEKAKVEIEKSKGEYKVNKSESTQTKMCIKTLKEIKGRDRRMEHLIEDFWPNNEDMILFGAGGTGKSMLTTLIAAEIVSPTENGLFGKYKVHKPGRVLFFQAENGEAAINERNHISRRLAELIEEHGDEIAFASEDDDVVTFGDIENAEYYDFVCKQIEEFKPDLVVFDPLSSFHRKDENDNSGMNRALNQFRKIIRKYKVNVLIVHHSGKTDSAKGRGAGRGASAIHGWCRNAIELKSSGDKNENLAIVHHKSSNLPNFGTLKFKRADDLDFVLSGAGENDQSKENVNTSKANPDKDALVKVSLEALGGKADNQQELIDKMMEISSASGHGVSSGTAYRQIKDATDSGLIVAEKSTGNTKVIWFKTLADIRF